MNMGFIDVMQEKAKKAPKRIVFPEATADKILKAAQRLVEMGIAFPVLVGAPAEINAAAEEHGVSLVGCEIVDHTDGDTITKVVEAYLKVDQSFSEKSLRRKSKNTLSFGAMLVRLGMADCYAAGYEHSTSEVAMAAQVFIGTMPGIGSISSLGMVEFPSWTGPQENFLCFTDCAVQPRPNAGQLVDIAAASSHTVKTLLDWEPRVALLSFSTCGSAEHEDVDVVHDAVILAHERFPELKIDGEFQLDAAIIPAVAAKKVKRPSDVAGKANVLVFPNLGAGNLGVKMVQIFDGAIAYGPVMQGFAKPVADFSRSAPLDEIVGNLAMLVVLAGE